VEHLDGNAVGGELMEIFGVEMTVATSVCGSCGATGAVAELRVYTRAPGTVIRCPSCEAVLMRIVRGRDRLWLDLSGIRTLTFSPPEA
jgi:hypothetical protein